VSATLMQCSMRRRNQDQQRGMNYMIKSDSQQFS